MLTPEQMEEAVEAMARAGKSALCSHREGPYGVYKYGTEQQPVYHIRDFRDTKSVIYGKTIFTSEDSDVAQAEYDRLTNAHIYGAALTAALPVIERAKWQPIETAPKDGTSILLFASDYPPLSYMGVGQWAFADPDLGFVEGWFWPFAIRPTHWMPLPVPPLPEAP